MENLFKQCKGLLINTVVRIQTVKHSLLKRRFHFRYIFNQKEDFTFDIFFNTLALYFDKYVLHYKWRGTNKMKDDKGNYENPGK